MDGITVLRSWLAGHGNPTRAISYDGQAASPADADVQATLMVDDVITIPRLTPGSAYEAIGAVTNGKMDMEDFEQVECRSCPGQRTHAEMRSSFPSTTLYDS